VTSLERCGWTCESGNDSNIQRLRADRDAQEVLHGRVRRLVDSDALYQKYLPAGSRVGGGGVSDCNEVGGGRQHLAQSLIHQFPSTFRKALYCNKRHYDATTWELAAECSTVICVCALPANACSNCVRSRIVSARRVLANVACDITLSARYPVRLLLANWMRIWSVCVCVCMYVWIYIRVTS
jgi:hypothetical protein